MRKILDRLVSWFLPTLMFSTLVGFSVVNLRAFQGGLWWMELIFSGFFLAAFLLSIKRQGPGSIYAYIIWVLYLVFPDLIERFIYGADPRYRDSVLHSARIGVVSSWLLYMVLFIGGLAGIVIAFFEIAHFIHLRKRKALAPDFVVSAPRVGWKNPPGAGEVLDFIRSYQKAGFFRDENKNYPELLVGAMDDNLMDVGNEASSINFLARDERKTWWADPESFEYGGEFVSIVEGLAAISGERFKPLNILEAQDGKSVAFHWNGSAHRLELGKIGTESCLKLITNLNRLLKDQDFRFYYFCEDNLLIFVLGITGEEKKILAGELRWKFNR